MFMHRRNEVRHLVGQGRHERPDFAAGDRNTPNRQRQQRGQLQLVNIVKSFADTAVIRGISVSIAPGEFFSIIGPSGCGKTTTLQILAGFESPTSGDIVLDGEKINSVPPHKRNVNTVFQSYALFPHYNVFDNVAFGLRRRGCRGKELREKVFTALDTVQLTDFAGRKPNRLSGGQRQRVALARAFILNPSVLLLDEPLSALDAQLRKALRVDLKMLQRKLKMTFVYVTHDQEEALSMSDRIAVMHDGRFEQVGTAREVYNHPNTEFVARFLGASNIISARVEGRDGAALRISLCGERFAVQSEQSYDDEKVLRCFVRPEHVRLQAVPPGGTVSGLRGAVYAVVYLGNASRVFLRLPDGQSLCALIGNDDCPYESGMQCRVIFDQESIQALSE